MTAAADPAAGDELVVIGPSFAGYVKVVRLLLEEKGLAHRLEHFDFPGRPPGFEALNPFGKVPVLRHAAFVLHEAVAIARYLEASFPEPRLEPALPRDLARMAQVISIMDQVGAPAMLRTVYSQRFRQRVIGAAHDEHAIQEALPLCRTTLAMLERMLDESGGEYLVGASPTVADFFVSPNLAYFADTDEGAALLAEHRGLSAWLARMGERPSVTRFGLPELPAPRLAHGG